MRTFCETLEFVTKGELDMLDITERVQGVVSSSGLKEGLANVFVIGSTAAVTTIEYEPGLKKDFPAMLERIAPKEIYYHHHETWHDYNGHSHVRASLIGPSLTVPFKDGRLILGTWQQIVFIELDVRPRHRRVHVQLLGV